MESMREGHTLNVIMELNMLSLYLQIDFLWKLFLLSFSLPLPLTWSSVNIFYILFFVILLAQYWSPYRSMMALNGSDEGFCEEFKALFLSLAIVMQLILWWRVWNGDFPPWKLFSKYHTGSILRISPIFMDAIANWLSNVVCDIDYWISRFFFACTRIHSVTACALSAIFLSNY